MVLPESVNLSPGIFGDTPDTPEGFEFFFKWLVRDKDGVPLELTEHARRWIEAVYDAEENDRGVIIKAFRGAAKSIVMSAFMAWKIGKHPTNSNLVIRSSYNSAQDTGLRIAKMIAHNDYWALFFPNIRPDDEQGGAGWSATNGYEVIDISMPRGEWTRLNAGRISPTLSAFPYSSKSIIGNRVTGLLLIDDILDEQNTSSELELSRVRISWTDTISRTRVPGASCVFIGTPWLTDDLLSDLEKTGEYLVLETPVYGPDGRSVWPEIFSEQYIKKLIAEDLTGGPGFARMYLLDPSQIENRTFDPMFFDQDAVRTTWKYRGGLDYASIEGGGALKYKSHFALAYLGQNPETGDWIVTGGVLEQFSQSKAEETVMRTQKMFPNWEYTVSEGDGKGAEFNALLARNPEFRIVEEKTGGVNKEKRLVNGLEPLLRSGRLKISTADTKFLNSLREFLNTYPNVSRNSPGWDAADSVYWGIFHEMQAPPESSRRRRSFAEKPVSNPYYLLAKS